ncbi:MAG: FtsH protease activity modulator HflK [Defluviitaleaceae bacterium]|nr:FtsH protease activity modulator HflK [Defluviitaleaceae bacterium]MCL2837276.1 FtsH protease activity modulator HflK [Defluviitaleaceae bacterium]
MDDAKQLKRMYNAIIAVAVLVAVLILAYAGFYTVTEQERAVVTTFGRVSGVNGSGIHFRVPIAQNVRKVNTTIRGLEFGYDSSRGFYVPNESESFMITEDFNFVNVDFYVQWQISDPVKFLFSSEEPVQLLRNILQAEARSVVSSYGVDDVLTVAKTEIQILIFEGVSTKLEEYDIGLVVRNIAIQDTTPPTDEVISAFKNVENARQFRDTQINAAWAYYNTIIPAARAVADGIVKDAQAEKESRVNMAVGQTARFNEMFEEYILYPDITQTRMYLEMTEEVFPYVTMFVDGGGNVLRLLDINPAQSGGATPQRPAYGTEGS